MVVTLRWLRDRQDLYSARGLDMQKLLLCVAISSYKLPCAGDPMMDWHRRVKIFKMTGLLS